MIQDLTMECPSPPNKTSLTNWWKQFKSKQSTRRDEEVPPALTTNTYPYQGPEGFGASADGSSLDNNLLAARPRMPYKSRSSSAIQTPNSVSGEPETMENNNSTEYSQDESNNQSPIFGVPLAKSIEYANVSISLSDPQGEQFIYGYIPIVVAKCGVYLKQNATTVEGIFRLSGSAKRIKDLQYIFNAPPRFGKGLDWTGFNVHDAANVLRRYLNNLPEPIIPLEFYEKFRDPLRDCTTIMAYLENKTAQQNPSFSQQSESDPSKSPSEHESDNYDFEYGIPEDSPLGRDILRAVDRYQVLIANLPPLNRQLLMYILDLLAVFASRSEENLMPAPNLAAIFQPSILSHPTHDMSPSDYHLSRAVIEFMIEHSNKFLAAVEAIAIEEHERKKLEKEKDKAKKQTMLNKLDNGSNNNNSNNAKNPNNANNNNSYNDIISSNNSNVSDKVRPNINNYSSDNNLITNSNFHLGKQHGRKHSKSLSSANIASNSTQPNMLQNHLPITSHAKIPNAYAPPSTVASNTPISTTDLAPLINPKTRARSGENKIPRVPVDQPSTENNSNSDGIIKSTLRHASSLSRRTSLRKTSKTDSSNRLNTASKNNDADNHHIGTALSVPNSSATNTNTRPTDPGLNTISITITGAPKINQLQGSQIPQPHSSTQSTQQFTQSIKNQSIQSQEPQTQLHVSGHKSRPSLSLNGESIDRKRNGLSNLVNRMQSPVRKQKLENPYTESNNSTPTETTQITRQSPSLLATRSPIVDHHSGGLPSNINPLSPDDESNDDEDSKVENTEFDDRNSRSRHRNTRSRHRNTDYSPNGNSNDSSRSSNVSKWRKSIIAITGNSGAHHSPTEQTFATYNGSDSSSGNSPAHNGGGDNTSTTPTTRSSWFQRMRSSERRNLSDGKGGKDDLASLNSSLVSGGHNDDESSFTFERGPSGPDSPNLGIERE